MLSEVCLVSQPVLPDLHSEYCLANPPQVPTAVNSDPQQLSNTPLASFFCGTFHHTSVSHSGLELKGRMHSWHPNLVPLYPRTLLWA